MKSSRIILIIVGGFVLFGLGVWVGSYFGIKKVPVLNVLPLPSPAPSPSPTPSPSPSPVVNPFEEAPVNPFEKVKTNPFE